MSVANAGLQPPPSRQHWHLQDAAEAAEQSSQDLARDLQRAEARCSALQEQLSEQQARRQQPQHRAGGLPPAASRAQVREPADPFSLDSLLWPIVMQGLCASNSLQGPEVALSGSCG